MKISTAQVVLRRLAREKQAGAMLPIAAGIGLVAAADGVKSTMSNARTHQAGFNPNYVPGRH